MGRIKNLARLFSGSPLMKARIYKRISAIPARGERIKTAAITNERGVALIVVILAISIIVALTIQLNRDMRAQMYAAANLSDQTRLRYVAESGIYAAQALLLADKNGFDALTEDWANTEMVSLKSEEFFDNASFKLTIEDEGGKININNLVAGKDREMLLRLLTGPYFHLKEEAAGALLDSIKDWIDGDDDASGKGSEEGAKNGALDCIEELLMITGVSREVFYGSEAIYGLSRCLSVFGDGKININTAPRPVLLALSAQMTGEAVEALDAYRRDEKNSVADVGWVQGVPEATGLNIPVGSLTVKSDIFQIKAVGVQGRMKRQIDVVVSRDAGRTKIATLSWKVE
jgi:general secretion pathway protein K